LQSILNRNYAFLYLGCFKPTIMGLKLVNFYKMINIPLHRHELRANMGKQI